MALILSIESSTEVCSVTIARDGTAILSREELTGQNHARLLTVFIDEVLICSNIAIEQLDAVAVSGGPGSYTGLRIGVSVAKGICYALHLPLCAISSLESLAHHVIHDIVNHISMETDKVLFCPMIDARRMEVYTSFYDKNETQIRRIQADIIDHKSYLDFLENNTVYFFGNGAAKCREAITHPNAIFINGIFSSSKNMIGLAERNFRRQEFVDVAYYEPFYLKDFVTTIPVKNKIQ